MQYKMWTTYNINICLDWASDDAKAELEKEIQGFIEWLTWFKYYELNIDQIHWDRNFNLRSVNNI